VNELRDELVPARAGSAIPRSRCLGASTTSNSPDTSRKSAADIHLLLDDQLLHRCRVGPGVDRRASGADAAVLEQAAALTFGP
jgi:hypothetical protein